MFVKATLTSKYQRLCHKPNTVSGLSLSVTFPLDHHKLETNL